MLSIPAEQKAHREKAAARQVRFQVQPCMTCQAMVPSSMKIFSSGHRGHDGDRWEGLDDRWIGRVVELTMMEHHHRQDNASFFFPAVGCNHEASPHDDALFPAEGCNHDIRP